MSDDTTKLFRRLEITEKVINGLLTSKSDLAMVEKKLNTLQELVADLPPGRADLDEAWSQKLVHLWTVFAGKGGSDAEDGASSGSIRSSASIPSLVRPIAEKPAHVFPPSPPPSEELLLNFGEAPISISPMKPKLAASPRKISSPPLLIDLSPPNPKPAFQTPPLPFPKLETFSFFKYPNLLVDEARMMIKDAFSAMPPIEKVNDIQAIRAYLGLVLKARNVIEPYWDDAALERRLIAECILPKLPIERQTTYLNRPASKQNFYGLVFVLQSALVRCFFEAQKEELVAKSFPEVKQTVKNQPKSGGGARGDGGRPRGPPRAQAQPKPRQCFYCESLEHLIWSCPQIGQLERLKAEPGTSKQKEGEEAHLLPPFAPVTPPGESEEVKMTRKLTTLEATVGSLMEQGKVEFAHEKMSHLADTVNRLPPHFANLSGIWSDKVATLLGAIANSEAPIKGAPSIGEKKKPKKGGPQRGLQAKENGKSARELSKETIRRKISDAYGRFPIITSGAHPKLAAFTLLTAKSFKLTKPFSRGDPLFPADMFDLAFAKLSADMQARYESAALKAAPQKTTTPKKPKILIELLSFLARESEITYAPQVADNSLYCHFCKRKGHDARTCPRLPNRLCFCCFQKGHDWKRCHNAPLTPSDLMNSI